MCSVSRICFNFNVRLRVGAESSVGSLPVQQIGKLAIGMEVNRDLLLSFHRSPTVTVPAMGSHREYPQAIHAPSLGHEAAGKPLAANGTLPFPEYLSAP